MANDLISSSFNTWSLFPVTGAAAYPNARFGQGSGPIAFSNLHCTGTEASIFDCESDGIGVIGSCTHADDASLSCQESKFPNQ